MGSRFWGSAKLFSKVAAPLSTPQWRRVPSISTSLPTLVSIHIYIYILILAILVGMKRFLILLLLCISLITNGVEYLFTCFVAICLSLKINVYFNPFIINVYFNPFDWVFYFLSYELFILKSFIIYSWYKSLIRYIIWKQIHSLVYIFTFFQQKTLHFYLVQLICFFLLSLNVFCVSWRNYYLIQAHKDTLIYSYIFLWEFHSSASYT